MTDDVDRLTATDPWERGIRPPERIDLGGLVLRRIRPDDVDELTDAVLASLPELLPWMPWAADYGRSSAEWFVNHAREAWDAGEEFVYGLEHDGPIVGTNGLIARIGPGGLEIGYWLRTDTTGRGLITRSTAALTAVAFEDLGADHVQIHMDPTNERSARVPERLGFRLVETRTDVPIEAPGHTGEQRICRLDADEFPTPALRRLLGRGTC